MLVLSRQPQQTLLFPTLGISVEVLRISGQTVRLGIVAPRALPVVRGELERPDSTEALRQSRHDLRGRLNTTTMALYLAQRQLQNGLSSAADATLQTALEGLEKLEKEWTAPPIPPPVTKEPAGARTGRRLRTLLVEDNQHESALLEGYLRLSGLEVARAEDGQQALNWLASNDRPDAVLLDMHMPGCDGPTTVAAIRANPSYDGLKVFAVTGSRAEDLGGAADRFDGWFSKPLNPANLVAALTKKG